MRHWNLSQVETPSGVRSPVVLHSQEGEDRVVLIELAPGQQLGEHQVKEAALLLVLSGSVRVETTSEAVEAGPCELFRFDPDERRAVTSAEGARVLLTLAPWPGEGHYRGSRDQAEISAS